ncbi:hypothetical protein HMPREF9103_01117, partial [Lentilactobacillus parafarraginis F0439]
TLHNLFVENFVQFSKSYSLSKRLYVAFDNYLILSDFQWKIKQFF